MPIRVNRTIDTRIFSSSESAVRREKGEERERVFDGPTEPPAPTEPIPNPGRGDRPYGAVSPRKASSPTHRDRAGTELSLAPCVVPGLPRHVRYRPTAAIRGAYQLQSVLDNVGTLIRGASDDPITT